jgi:SagB-type dehydrogenase family enzyme
VKVFHRNNDMLASPGPRETESGTTFRVYLNRDLFFSFESDRLICWNYRTGEQFELAADYFERLRRIGTGTEDYRYDAIDRDLLEGGLICQQQPSSGWKWSRIAHIFHVGTQNHSSARTLSVPESQFDDNYVEYCDSLTSEMPPVIVKRDITWMQLPPPGITRLENVSLWESLLKRQTSRDFKQRAVSLDTVSTILYSVFGAVHSQTRDDITQLGLNSYGYRRTSASAGGLQSVEPYLLNFSIENLEEGTFHYHSIEHRLYPVTQKEAFTQQDLVALLHHQYFAGELAFAIFLVLRFDKLWWKYPQSRAYRVGLMDAGLLSQTFQLVCAALSLDSWMTGQFYDEEIEMRLGLDPEQESCVFVLGAGVGSGSPLPAKMIERLRSRAAG